MSSPFLTCPTSPGGWVLPTAQQVANLMATIKPTPDSPYQKGSRQLVAEVLGKSSRTIGSWRTGAKPIPWGYWVVLCGIVGMKTLLRYTEWEKEPL